MIVTLVSPHDDLADHGIRLIAACLRRQGHRVRLVFMPGGYGMIHGDAALAGLVRLARGSELVGVSLMTNYLLDARQITAALRSRLGVPVVWGGVHPTLMPAECLEDTDLVCVGEGEFTVVELAEALERGRPLHGVAGLWFRDDGGHTVANPDRPPVNDLDTLPPPDHSGDDHWLWFGGRFRPLDAGLLGRVRGRTYLTLSSRGCANSCTYCCSRPLARDSGGEPHRIRRRGVASVIGELVQVRRRLPWIDHVTLDDDAFFAQPLAHIESFADRYRAEVGLPLTISGAAPRWITRDRLTVLVRAGMVGLRMGIQSGSARTMALYGRPQSSDDVLRATRLLDEFREGIPCPQFDVLLDNPWEDVDDHAQTLRLLARLPVPYRLIPFSLVLYPGTALYRRAAAEGRPPDLLRDIVPRDFTRHEDNALNRLYELVRAYAINGAMIPAPALSRLIDEASGGGDGLSVAYLAARARLIPHRRRQLGELARKTLGDLRRADTNRIRRRIRRRLGARV